MMTVKVLLVDTTQYAPSSPLFYSALVDTDFPHVFFDEAKYLKKLGKSLFQRVAFRVMQRRPLTFGKLNRDLEEAACTFRPDVVVVSKGTYLAAKTIRRIKQKTGSRWINFATDDPFNPANAQPDWLESIGEYDVYACTKKAILSDVKKRANGRVVFLPFAYHPHVHFHEEPPAHLRKSFESDVVFLGGMDSDRIPLFEALAGIDGIRLALYGGYWQRHPTLRSFHRGFAFGQEFRWALSSSKMTIALVRRANRDGHSMRSFEVPACGSFMLTEDTAEHREMFQENEDTLFFQSTEQLVQQVTDMLARPEDRARMALKAHQKIVSGANTYRDRLLQLLELALEGDARVGELRCSA